MTMFACEICGTRVKRLDNIGTAGARTPFVKECRKCGGKLVENPNAPSVDPCIIEPLELNSR